MYLCGINQSHAVIMEISEKNLSLLVLLYEKQHSSYINAAAQAFFIYPIPHAPTVCDVRYKLCQRITIHLRRYGRRLN